MSQFCLQDMSPRYFHLKLSSWEKTSVAQTTQNIIRTGASHDDPPFSLIVWDIEPMWKITIKERRKENLSKNLSKYRQEFV